MDKPRIFLGLSGMQKKLLQALTRGLEDVAQASRKPRLQWKAQPVIDSVRP